MSYYTGRHLIFSLEERELIACGFKNQINELRTSIKDIDLITSKDKYNSKKQLMETYKGGLINEMIEKGQK